MQPWELGQIDATAFIRQGARGVLALEPKFVVTGGFPWSGRGGGGRLDSVQLFVQGSEECLDRAVAFANLALDKLISEAWFFQERWQAVERGLAALRFA